MRPLFSTHNKWISVLFGIFILFGLYLTTFYNFLLFHSIAEGFIIVVAFGIFIVAWNSRKFLENNFLLFIGIAYLFIAVLEFIHTLAYSGMGVFTGYGANLPTQLWIAARYMESISLIIALLFFGRRIRWQLLFSVYALITVLIFLSIFSWNIFPACFVEGSGLTLFKKISEYMICLIYLGVIIVLFQKQKEFEPDIYRLLIFAILLSIAAESAFTVYMNVNGLSNLAGHYFKIISFYFIYKAIIETGLTRPYDFLFRNLKKSEEKAGQERDRAQKYFDVAGVILVVINADQKVARINQKGCEILGYDESEIIGKNWFDTFVPEKQREKTRNFFIKLATGNAEQVNFFKNHVLTKDNKERLIAWYNSVLRNGDGKIIATLSSGEDITEKKQVEEALKQSEAKYRIMMEAMIDPAYICSHDFYIEYMNPAMIDKIGYDATGKSCYKALYDLDEKCSWCQFDKIQSGRHISYEREDLKTGRYYLINSSSIASSNAPASKISIFRDITEIKSMEKEKMVAEAKFRQAQKMESVGRLAGGVAHDYNNALSVIMGYTEMAMMKIDPTDNLYDDLNQVLIASKRAANITRQLLAFARKQTIAPEVLDLNENVENMLKMLRRLIGEDIDLSWLPGKGLWNVKMDPTQIDQILANLCVNARDAIEGVGKITIETGKVSLDEAYCVDHTGFVPGSFVLLSVSDNGCGMEKEILNKIFEPFFTTKAVDKGTGLGLSTVYGIAKQNKGFINAYSEPGKGTTIKIYLPRHEGKFIDTREESTPEIPQGRGETILVVEDDLSILQLTEKILITLDYTVLTADSPKKALGLAKEHAGDIHLLLTDVIMPEMNGLELADNLQILYPDLKRMFMSGYTANAIAHQGVLDQGVSFIQKPFSKNDLAKVIRKALDD
ncbi:MASE3 domain-containing protein [Desulfobacula sp.]